MNKLISFHIDKKLTNDDRAIFADNLLNTKYNYRDGISKKSTLRKFLSAYYGLPAAEELLKKFWQSSTITLGEDDCLINISWPTEKEIFPIDKFIKFIGKVMPQVSVKTTMVDCIPRIEILKYAYAQAVLSECSETIPLSSELTKDEKEKLDTLNKSMKNGSNYCFEHYICDTCQSHNPKHAWHTEFMPIWEES